MVIQHAHRSSSATYRPSALKLVAKLLFVPCLAMIGCEDVDDVVGLGWGPGVALQVANADTVPVLAESNLLLDEQPGGPADARPRAKREVGGLPSVEVLAEFDRSLDRYANMSYTELKARLFTPRDYISALPFDPTQARYFEVIEHRLKLTEAEVSVFKQNGFVSIDQRRRLNFAAAYQQIYTSDLPVFITSDSVLHALHKSYDAMLKELETAFFARTVDDLLRDCTIAPT